MAMELPPQTVVGPVIDGLGAELIVMEIVPDVAEQPILSVILTL